MLTNLTIPTNYIKEGDYVILNGKTCIVTRITTKGVGKIDKKTKRQERLATQIIGQDTLTKNQQIQVFPGSRQDFPRAYIIPPPTDEAPNSI